MRVQVRGYLTLKDIFRDIRVVDLNQGECSLKSLLEQLANVLDYRFAEDVLEPNSVLPNKYAKILINGRHYTHLKHKLETTLSDGDIVSFFPLVVGG